MVFGGQLSLEKAIITLLVSLYGEIKWVDFMDKKDARESRGSTDRKNHSSEKTKKIKYVTKYAGLYRTEAFSVFPGTHIDRNAENF